MKTRDDLDYNYVNSLLDYNPITGIFKWKVKRQGTRKNKIAGYSDPEGYIVIAINGKPYRANRLAWLLVTTEWPTKLVDHKNRIKNDNRWCNLRLANNSQNILNSNISKNNKLGVRGVVWHKRDKKYQASITVNNKKIHLGYHENIEDAIKARKKAEIKYFGEFANV